MECEPWYQCYGPSLKNVVDEHVAHFKSRATCSEEALQLIVTQCAQAEERKYQGFGSYRGYVTFVKRPLEKAIEKELGKTLVKNIKNSSLSNEVNCKTSQKFSDP